MTSKSSLGCTNLLIVFERGYETEENMNAMIRQGQSFLVCGKAGRKPVYDSITKVAYDKEGIPANMTYYSNEHVYTAQFEEKHTLFMDPDDPGSQQTVTMKVNLYLDMTDRVKELTQIKETLREEQSPTKSMAVQKSKCNCMHCVMSRKSILKK